MLPSGVTRRFLLALLLVTGFIYFLYTPSFTPVNDSAPIDPAAHKAAPPPPPSSPPPPPPPPPSDETIHATPQNPPKTAPIGNGPVSQGLLTGKVIAPKLENATIKAELGRSAWRVLHTTFARFPEHPTEDEKTALKSYIHLFQRLYPCGDCAEHFGQLLEKFPPQVGSRNSAAAWGCHVHNEVNKRLKKTLFDCNNIGDFYDCGCGDEKKKDVNGTSSEETSKAGELRDSEKSSRLAKDD